MSRNRPEVLKLKFEVAHNSVFQKKTQNFEKIYKTLILGLFNFGARAFSWSALSSSLRILGYDSSGFEAAKLKIAFWKRHFLKWLKFKWTQVITLITKKNHCTRQFTVTFAQNYLKTLYKINLARLQQIMQIKCHTSERTLLSYQFGRRNGTSNFKCLYLENLFSNMRSVSPWPVTY